MEFKGYKVDYKRKSGGFKKYVTYIPEEAERGRRDRVIGEMFSRESIIDRIEGNKAQAKK